MISIDFNDQKLHIGDTVKVKYNIVEGGKTRVQTFEGIIIAFSGRGVNKTFTVRRIGDRGVGVERIWPVDSKVIIGIEVSRPVKKIRRSKLYYLRGLTGRMATRV